MFSLTNSAIEYIRIICSWKLRLSLLFENWSDAKNVVILLFFEIVMCFLLSAVPMFSELKIRRKGHQKISNNFRTTNCAIEGIDKKINAFGIYYLYAGQVHFADPFFYGNLARVTVKFPTQQNKFIESSLWI